MTCREETTAGRVANYANSSKPPGQTCDESRAAVRARSRARAGGNLDAGTTATSNR